MMRLSWAPAAPVYVQPLAWQRLDSTQLAYPSSFLHAVIQSLHREESTRPLGSMDYIYPALFRLLLTI